MIFYVIQKKIVLLPRQNRFEINTSVIYTLTPLTLFVLTGFRTELYVHYIRTMMSFEVYKPIWHGRAQLSALMHFNLKYGFQKYYANFHNNMNGLAIICLPEQARAFVDP